MLDKLENITYMFATNKKLLWYYYYLCKTNIKINDSIRIAQTYISKDVICIELNSNFIKNTRKDQLLGVVLHELLHNILMHPVRKSANLNHKIWNLACDLEVNSIIYKEQIALPEFAKYPFTFKLPMHKTAEYYYSILIKNIKISELVYIMDDHSKWKDINVDKALLENTLKETSKICNLDIKVPDSIKSSILTLLQSTRTNWGIIISNYLHRTLKYKTRHSFKRFNRYYGELAKGRLVTKIAKVIVAIDTSRSIDANYYNKFMNELNQISYIYRRDIRVVYCDNKIQQNKNFIEILRTTRNIRYGNGATDFNPVFNLIKNKNYRLDLLIYFTDGEGAFPKIKPKYQVLWVYPCKITNKNKAPFGKCITLS